MTNLLHSKRVRSRFNCNSCRIAPHLRCHIFGHSVMTLRKVILPCAMACVLKSHQVLCAKVCAIETFPSVVPSRVTTMTTIFRQQGISFVGVCGLACSSVFCGHCARAWADFSLHKVLDLVVHQKTQPMMKNQETDCLQLLLFVSCKLTCANCMTSVVAIDCVFTGRNNTMCFLIWWKRSFCHNLQRDCVFVFFKDHVFLE